MGRGSRGHAFRRCGRPLVIVDTSAWVEYLRATQSPTHHTLRSALVSDAPIATPAPVLMELLAGCITEESALDIQQLLARYEILAVEGLAHFGHVLTGLEQGSALREEDVTW